MTSTASPSSPDPAGRLPRSPRLPARASRRLRHGVPRLPLAALDALQLGARLLRRGGRRQRRAPRSWIVDEDGSETGAAFARDVATRSSAGRQLPARPGRAARRPRAADAAATSVPLWEAMLACIKLGAVVIPATTLLHARRPADRIDRGEVRHVIAAPPTLAEVRRRAGARTRASPSATGRRAGTTSPTADARRRLHARRRRRAPTTRCSSTSLRARRRSRSWCCTRTRATRSATCRRCTGSACSRATSTSTSRRPAGPSTPGAASSRRGTPGAASSSSTTPRFHAEGAARRAGARAGVDDAVRAADRVAHADPGGPARRTAVRAARGASAPASR